MARRRRAPRPLHVLAGNVEGPSDSAAAAVSRLLTDGRSVVWCDDRGHIWVTADTDADNVQSHQVIGVYGFGIPTSQVELDVFEMKRDRARNWIAD